VDAAWWLVGLRLAAVIAAVVGCAAAVADHRTLTVALAIAVVLSIGALSLIGRWRLRGYRGR
jgi:hypothetical protein